MKKKMVVLLLISLGLLFINLPAQAQQNKFGLGIILGEPTGLIAKYWTSRTTAFDVAGSWSFEGKNSFHLHADYLFHSFNLIKVDSGKLPFYYGFGFRVSLKDDTRLGIRIPVGLSYMFEKTPIDIFMEIGPVMDIIPATVFRVSAFIGFRYYF